MSDLSTVIGEQLRSARSLLAKRRKNPPNTESARRFFSPHTLLIVTVAALVGFSLTTQLRYRVGLSEHLEHESERDLTRIFANLNEESARLRDEIVDLRLNVDALESSRKSEAVALQDARRELEQVELLSGATAAAGPGVLVTISDPKGEFTYDVLLDLIQELRDAGAEAIAVGGHRVGAATAFGEKAKRVTVGGVPVDAPYRVLAIGDPATLEGGLRIPGGAADSVGALREARIAIERRAEVRVPALERLPVFQEAKPLKVN